MKCDCNGCGGYAEYKARQKAEAQARFEAWLAMTPAEREALKEAQKQKETTR